MFDIFRSGAEWWIVALLVLLLHGPVGFYLAGAWKYRRDEILDGLSAASKRKYFETFHPGRRGTAATFERYYASRFGRRRYVLPSVFLLVIGGTAALWTVESVLVWTRLRPEMAGILDATSVAALSGAYVWVVADLIARWRFRDLSPADLWWSSWRMVMAVPMALAIARTFAAELAVPIAFLLGAFPTRSISTITRRFARRTLNLGADTDEKAESELERLQGIDTRIAERFADEGVTTILQLAYADPIELTMRCASFTFSFVIDVASQALAWMYLEDKLIKLRVCSLRGAQEVASLIDDLDSDDQDAQRLARATLAVAAGIVGVDAAVLETSFRAIAEDPYTQFLRDIWGTDPAESE